MGHENHGITNSTISLSMPQEPRGSYRGSNEFIRKCYSRYYSFLFNVFVIVLGLLINLQLFIAHLPLTRYDNSLH